MPEVKIMNIAPKSLIVPEKTEDFMLVEKLAENAFGPGRFTRTAFRLREGAPHEPGLSFVTWKTGVPIASVRLTRIWIGDHEGLLLGPLVVAPEYKNCGFGAELMSTAVKAARAADHTCILLVGDYPYYQRFGFEIVKPGKIVLPGPVDPQRLLICPLQEGIVDRFSGMVRPFS